MSDYLGRLASKLFSHPASSVKSWRATSYGSSSLPAKDNNSGKGIYTPRISRKALYTGSKNLLLSMLRRICELLSSGNGKLCVMWGCGFTSLIVAVCFTLLHDTCCYCCLQSMSPSSFTRNLRVSSYSALSCRGEITRPCVEGQLFVLL